MALIFHLQDKIKNSFVHFAFRNENGEIEFAYGTRNKDLIPEDKQRRPRMNEKFKEQSYRLCSSGSKYQPYFDPNANEWKQFDIDSLLWVKDEGIDRNVTKEEFNIICNFNDSL